MWTLAKRLLSQIGHVLRRGEPTNAKAAAHCVAVDCAPRITLDEIADDIASKTTLIPAITPSPSLRNTFALPERLRATAQLNRPARHGETHPQRAAERASSRRTTDAHKVAVRKVAPQAVRMQAALAQSRRRHEAERKMAAVKVVVTLPVAIRKPEPARHIDDLCSAA